LINYLVCLLLCIYSIGGMPARGLAAGATANFDFEEKKTQFAQHAGTMVGGRECSMLID
jgi:hypothetical protein